MSQSTLSIIWNKLFGQFSCMLEISYAFLSEHPGVLPKLSLMFCQYKKNSINCNCSLLLQKYIKYGSCTSKCLLYCLVILFFSIWMKGTNYQFLKLATSILTYTWSNILCEKDRERDGVKITVADCNRNSWKGLLFSY